MVWYASDSFDFGSSRQCLSKSVCGDDAFDMVCAYFRQAIARYINKLRIFVCGVCARHTGGDIKTINMNGKRMKKKQLYPRTKMIENELYGLRHHCHKYKNIPKWLTDLRYWKIFILSHFISRCNVRLLLFFLFSFIVGHERFSFVFHSKVAFVRRERMSFSSLFDVFSFRCFHWFTIIDKLTAYYWKLIFNTSIKVGFCSFRMRHIVD